MEKIATCAYCSLGCKVNQYDTEAMRELMERAGYITVPFDDAADVYIINTCSVTHVSDRKSRQMISRAHTKNPDAVIVVAGCYAKTDPETVSNLSGVNIVLGTNDRNSVVDVINNYLNDKDKHQIINSASDKSFEELSADESDKTRAYLKIQDGCNRFCSYCIIPYARGRIRSRSLESVKSEMRKLADHGYKEIVLTGIHTMSYGMDLSDNVDLTDAISQADDIDGIRRIRLGSLEPELMSDKFIDYLASNSRICRQFHMSLQSGSDTVLRRMNRRYTADRYAEKVEKLRKAIPGCAITTDIIAGFVGETEQEHRETLEFVKRIGFAKVHVFPYSVRKGTRAAEMPGHIDPSVKDRRAHELIELASQYQTQYMNGFVGQTTEVLAEEPCIGGYRGYTDTYVDVHADLPADCVNQLVQVEITGVQDDFLTGKAVKN